ncbi:MAG: hypothetical protein ABH867_02720 [Patescibacteria group bacterium]|nr:hypothetical protein [Patescibacteria group bacterium]
MANGENHSNSFLQLGQWSYQPKLKGLSGIYLNTAVRDLAFNLMGIFVPIYIFKISGSAAVVFLYYFLVEFFVVLTTIPVAKLISRIGPDISILLSNITRSVFLVFLTLAKSSKTLFWASTFFEAVTVPLYWLPYHSAFSSQSKRGKLSRQIAKLSNITRIVTISAPLIGGLIAQTMGLDVLFPIGILLLIASSLPIFLDEYNRKETAVPVKEINEKMALPKNRKLFLGLFFEGLRLPLNGIGWPLILYAVIPNFEKIGGLTTLTSILCLFTVIWLSKRINHFNIKTFASGNVARVFVWIARGLSLKNPFLIALSDPVFNISSVFSGLPYTILTYNLGKKEGFLFFIQREFALHGGYMIGNFIVFLILFLGFPWETVIAFTSVCTALMTWFLCRYGKERLKQLPFPFRPKFGRI